MSTLLLGGSQPCVVDGSLPLESESGSGVPVLVLAARGSWHEMVKRWRANVRPKS